jgi:hypothetical protein
MRPKGKLFALFAVFAAIGLVTATGAFTSVEADRTVEVEVEGDASALLALEPADTSNYPNGAYARSDGGQLQIVLNSSNSPGNGGTGINQDAVTKLDNVFNITNQGTQPVDLTVTATANSPSNLNTGSGSGAPNIYFYQGGDEGSEFSGATSVSTGNTEQVGIFINSQDLSTTDTVDVTLTVNATASS